MRISKWHETQRKSTTRKALRRDNYRRQPAGFAVEAHYISIDGDAFERIERVAKKRRTSITRLVDSAINWMLDREAMI